MTTDGEFEAVDQFVRQCVARIEGTPYLAPGTVWTFLGELAHAKRSAMAVPTLARWTRWIWSPEMTAAERHTAVTKLFTESGIATVVDDQLQFVSDTTRHYLMAQHVVKRKPKGPRRFLLWKSKYLQARTEWSAQDKEFTRFLVIMWWPKVVAQLGKFLREQHRYPNIFFVADLCRRGRLEGSDLPERVITALGVEVGTAKRPEDAWRAMVECLYSLDPAATVTELENAVRSPTRHMTVLRQLPAVIELTRYDPALGAANLVYLADHLWGDPGDQVAVAIGIAEIDYDLGARTLARLAKDPSLGESRVQAALQVDFPELWCELIGDDSLADNGRERLLAGLLERHPAAALAVVRAFVDSVQEERTPLRIAELIKDHDRDLAWQVAYDLSWTTQRTVGSAVRLDGVLLLGRLDPPQAEKMLYEFAAWSDMDDEIRLEAARIVYPMLSKRRRVELYSTIARTADGDETAMTVARSVIDMNRDAGERLMAELTQRDMAFELRLQAATEAREHGRYALMTWVHSSNLPQVRIAAAKALWPIDPALSERFIEELAREHGIGEVRIQAAKAMPKGQVLSYLVAIVRDDREPEDLRCAAGVLVMEQDNDAGRYVLAELADAPQISLRMREHIAWLLQQ